MQKKSLLLLLIATVICLILASCKQGEQVQNNGVAEKAALQALPKEMIDKMYAEVDYIDYLWHDLPFSLSQEEKEKYQHQHFIYIRSGHGSHSGFVSPLAERCTTSKAIHI